MKTLTRCAANAPREPRPLAAPGRRAFLLLAFWLGVGCGISVAQAVRIMPVGNSITQGDAAHSTYRRPLWQKLQAGGYAVDFVGSQSASRGGPTPNPDFDLDHEGHWGWRADQLLASILGWAQAHRPDVVLLHAGSNDIFQNQPPAQTRDEIGLLIDRLREANPAVKVVVAQVIPNRQAIANNNLKAYNALLPALVAAKTTPQSPVVLVDQHTGYNPATDSYDDAHPNEIGEEKMAGVWFQALRTLLAPPTPLPVTLLRFTATATPAGTVVRWETASEVRNAGFYLERSTDGQHFTTQAAVAGRGSAGGGARYEHVDRDLPAASRLYYRLRQRDTDGLTTYFPVAAVGVAGSSRVGAYPMPAAERITLTGLPPEQTAVRVHDVHGREHRLPVLPSGQVDIRGLPAGVYWLHGPGQGQRFIKQP